MAKEAVVKEGVLAVDRKLSELEERIDIIHDSLKDLNSAVDMLVRFSMTAKAFMELSISQGLVDPHELNSLASRYEKSYTETIEAPNTHSNVDFL